MAMQYPDGTWCVRNKDKQYKSHDTTKVDVVAGNGRFGFRICPDERTAKERQIEKHGEFYRQPKKRKRFYKGNLCHTTPKIVGKKIDPILMSLEVAKAIQEVKDAIKRNSTPVVIKLKPLEKRRRKHRRSCSARMLHSRRDEHFDLRSGKDALAWYKRISK